MWFLLCAIVVLLGVDLAATPAHNSDLLLHLANGRMLSDGEVGLRTDPFSYVLEGQVWINHSWLFDLLTYGLFASAGASVLVLVKALLFGLVGLALVLLGWEGGKTPVLAVATSLLGLVAMAQGAAPVHPIGLSVVFLAATLVLLEKARQTVLAAANPTSWLVVVQLWPLVVLSALWVNLDAWFVLGPVVILLYLAGSWWESLLQPVKNQNPNLANAWLRGLGQVLLASLLACLLNPSGIFAFQVPPPLSFVPMYTILVNYKDPMAWTLLTNPFLQTYNNPGNPSVANLAFFLLTLGCVAGFFLNRPRFSRVWFVLWLFFFALAAFHVRLIPFFAVVAAPGLARNLRDWQESRSRLRPRSLAEQSLLDRGLERFVLLVGLLLLVLGWPGWLQNSRERRNLEIVFDPTLTQAAQRIMAWREENKLDSGHHTFNMNIELAPYLAWFGSARGAIREKTFLDGRYGAFPLQAIEEFAQIRRHLRAPADSPREEAKATAWEALLKKWNIDRVALTELDLERFQNILLPLAQNRFALLWTCGRSALLGWNSEPGVDSWEKLTWSHTRLAYNPESDQWAPVEWPGRLAREPQWFDAFSAAKIAVSPDRDEAALYLKLYDRSRTEYQKKIRPVEEVMVSASIAPRAAGVDMPWALLLYLSFNSPNIAAQVAAQMDKGSEEVLWLAIRAARRAIAADPDDATAWLHLAEAYHRMLRETQGGRSRAVFPVLAQLRRLQAVTAYQQVLDLEPRRSEAHLALASVLDDLGCNDAALHHQLEGVRLLRERGPPKGQDPAAFAKNLGDMESTFKRKQERLEQISRELRANFSKMKIQDRALSAFRVGLGELALGELTSVDPERFGPEGLELELDLLLKLGKTQNAYEWGKPEGLQYLLGTEKYSMLRLLVAMSVGNYQEADQHLVRMTPQALIKRSKMDASGVTRKDMLAFTVAQMLLDFVPSHAFSLRANPREYQSAMQRFLVDEILEANGLTLRGMVALERGDTTRAAAFFDRALSFWTSDAAVREGKGIDFPGRTVAQYYSQRIADAKTAKQPETKRPVTP